MRLAGALVRAIANHHPLVCDDTGADHWIRRRPPETAARLFERTPHPASVRGQADALCGGGLRYHFSWKSAST
jgi:hypothetical protein